MSNRFLLALLAYAVLAVVAIATLDDARIRGATVAILALFAVKTWVRRHDGFEAGRDREGR